MKSLIGNWMKYKVLTRLPESNCSWTECLAKKTDVDRIYLPCQEDGKSLMNEEHEYKAKMTGLQKYMTNKDDIQIQAIHQHQNSKAVHYVTKKAETYLHKARTIHYMSSNHDKAATWKAKKLKLKYKEDYKKLVKDKWKDKAMHGKFPRYLHKNYVDTELSFQWMNYTGLKGRDWGAYHISTGSVTEYQILQQAHFPTRNHWYLQNVS